MPRVAKRDGFTLIEILVVIAVIGLLIALTIPTVQASREAARRALCLNNMKQIGLALHGHVDAHGLYPAGEADITYTSFLVHSLPYLEQQSLYNSFNLSQSANPYSNTTSTSSMPSTLTCPSDTANSRPWPCATNYAANSGPEGGGSNGSGVFFWKPLRPRDISDGLSSTVGVTEWVTGTSTIGYADPLTSLFSISAGNQGSIDGFVSACSAVQSNTSTNFVSRFAYVWHKGGLNTTQYDHVMTPNQPSCSVSSPQLEAVTAGSSHPGGVNSLFMDGSVRFVKDSVDRRVWSALGTRSGNEVIEASSMSRLNLNEKTHFNITHAKRTVSRMTPTGPVPSF